MANVQTKIKQFIPTRPQWDINTSTASYNLFLAGQGSGKTANMAVNSINYSSNFPHVRGLICANTQGQLTRSTMKGIRDIWEVYYGVTEYSRQNPNGQYVVSKQPPEHFNTAGHNFDTYYNILTFSNGAVIYIGSLENYKALDGMEIGWAMLDETKDTREEAVKEVIIARIRQRGLYVDKYQKTRPIIGYTNDEHKSLDRETKDSLRAFNPLFIFTSPAKVQWLNEMFELDKFEDEIISKIFSKTDYFVKDFKTSEAESSKTRVVISSAYLNEANLPEGDIERRLGKIPEHLVDSLIYGSPFSKSGGEFYYAFSRQKHVKSGLRYNPELPLHITFDENVVPYFPCVIFQVDVERRYIWQVTELCLEDPYNNVHDSCAEIIRIFPNHSAGVFIYGDATSQKGDARQERLDRKVKETLYTTIKKLLRQYKPKLRVPRSNPLVSNRRDFINWLLDHTKGKRLTGWYVEFLDSCKQTINDFVFCKQDENGGKLKVVEKNPITKVSYQKYGHTSDAFDYFICELLKKEFKNFRKPNHTWEEFTEIINNESAENLISNANLSTDEGDIINNNSLKYQTPQNPNNIVSTYDLGSKTKNKKRQVTHPNKYKF